MERPARSGPATDQSERGRRFEVEQPLGFGEHLIEEDALDLVELAATRQAVMILEAVVNREELVPVAGAGENVLGDRGYCLHGGLFLRGSPSPEYTSPGKQYREQSVIISQKKCFALKSGIAGLRYWHGKSRRRTDFHSGSG